MTFIPPELQAELNGLYDKEKNAVGHMLLLAVQHGFSLTELTRLADKYHVSAAWLETQDSNYCVSYATANGFFHRHFGSKKSAAEDFTASFVFHNDLPSGEILSCRHN
ncbi:hypothetical protein JD793_002715 [Citrobacter braakii]|nr:hypothetical protein [Citrobacter braakii]